MESAGNNRIEDCFEMIPKKAQNLSTNGEEWLRNVNRRQGIPQQHYSVEIKVPGGRQMTEVVLQFHGCRTSGA